MSPQRSKLSLNQKLTLLIALLAVIATIAAAFIGGHDWFSVKTSVSESASAKLHLKPNLWSGQNQTISGSSNAWFSEKAVPNGFYSIDFWLDDQKYGRVTLDFVYPTPQDLSQYQAIQFTLVFNEPNNPCYFYIESEKNGVALWKEPILLRDSKKPVWYDITNGRPINTYIDASYLPTLTEIGSYQYQFRIALSNYEEYKTAVKKIGIFIDTHISKGSHSLMIGDIQFLK